MVSLVSVLFLLPTISFSLTSNFVRAFNSEQLHTKVFIKVLQPVLKQCMSALIKEVTAKGGGMIAEIKLDTGDEIEQLKDSSDQNELNKRMLESSGMVVDLNEVAAHSVAAEIKHTENYELWRS